MNPCRLLYIALPLILAGSNRLAAQTPWHYLGVDGLGVRIGSLAFSSSNRLFAGTERNGVYQFDGARWYALNTGLPTTMSSVNVVVNSKNVLVAWTPAQRAWRYSASRWVPMNTGLPDSVDVYTLSAAPDGTFWTVLKGGTIWYYDPTLDVWYQQKPVLTQSAAIYGIAFIPSRMCAATADGVYWIRSQAWQPMNAGLGNIPVTAIASDSGGRLYAGSNNVLYSFDAVLDQWQPVPPSLPVTRKIRSIMFGPNRMPLLLTSDGLWQYNGSGWIAVDGGGLRDKGNINVAATDFAGRTVLGVASRGAFLHDSAGWRQHNAGLGTNTLFTALALGSGGKIHAGTPASTAFDGGVYRFDGTAWTYLKENMPDTESVTAIAVLGADEPVALTADDARAIWNVYRHTAAGWIGLDSAHRSGLEFRTVAFAPTGALLAGTTSGVFRYADTGWVGMNEGLGTGTGIFGLSFDGAGNVYARSADRLYRYDGTAWRQHGPILPDYIWSFKAGPNGELGISTHGKVYRYTGTAWLPITTGLPFGSNTEALAFSSRGELFAGASVGVYRFLDGGSWLPINTGLPNNKAVVYFLDFDRDEKLIAATEFGIWSSMDVSAAREKSPDASALGITPNPSAGQMRISYQLAQSSRVHLSLWNLRGEEVTIFIKNITQQPGEYSLGLDAEDLPNGAYRLLLRTGNRVTTRMVVMER